MNEVLQCAFGVEELSRAWRVSRSSLYRQMNSGNLSFVKLGGRRLITQRQAAEFLDRLEGSNGNRGF